MVNNVNHDKNQVIFFCKFATGNDKNLSDVQRNSNVSLATASEVKYNLEI